ncbi:hypothetical protein [Flexibacterium corallicola]|uniref:hypothetical protein n=1 Tax=Flexibacterium corallicola TaxID=3037259 RepID=UPI00286ED52C|nr:hypothetical protein [Pseudovibrio sp. M1P-2-3]
MIRLSVLLFLCGVSFAAACPEKLPESGITLTRQNPLFAATYKPTPKGLAEQRIMMREGKQEVTSTLYPHPLITEEITNSYGTLSFKYAKESSSLNSLNKTGHWQSDLVMYAGDKEIGRGNTKLRFMDQGKLYIGTCAYGVWRVEEQMEIKGSNSTLFDKFYSPKLGLVLRATKLTTDRKAISSVIFDKIEIAKSEQN